MTFQKSQLFPPVLFLCSMDFKKKARSYVKTHTRALTLTLTLTTPGTARVSGCSLHLVRGGVSTFRENRP